MLPDDTEMEQSHHPARSAQPHVSVYMLAYNHARFISDAIEGVLAQQCQFPIELIIGEDCSTDNTLAICLDYQERYPGIIRVLTNSMNIGARANAARCRQACAGRYIAICEGDDYWTDPTKLARQVRIMQTMPDVTLCCHATDLVDAVTGRLLRVHRSARRSRLLSNPELILGDGHLISTCSILVRREVLTAAPVWMEEAPVGDFPLVLRAAQLGKIAYINTSMATYRINVPGSWVTSLSQETSHRYEHARKMTRVLEGYRDAMPARWGRYIDIAISRFLYDAIIRTSGDLEYKRKLYSSEACNLVLVDRLLAKLAITFNHKLGLARRMRIAVPKFTRNLIHELIEDRLPDED